MVALLAASCLDETTVAAFVSFVNDDLTTLLEPLDILEAQKATDWTGKFKEIAKAKGGGKRVDRIAAICSRLFLHVTAEKYMSKPEHN
ncbi:MAG: ATPase, partial [Planctomycetia bacterium]